MRLAPIADWAMAALRGVFLLSVAVAVLPNGSIGEVAYYTSTALNGLIFALAAVVPIRNRETLRLHRTVLILVALSIAYVGFQATSFAGNPLANPAWENTADIVKSQSGAISIAPWVSLRAIPALVTPFMVFMTALILHQSDHAAQNLWKRLALFGAAVAIVSLARHQFFPGAHLFGTRPTLDVDSLTGNFYNRSNTAAFLALSAFAMLGLLFIQMTRINTETIRHRFRKLQFFDSRKHTIVLIYALLFFLCLITLFMTRSRAGVGFGTLLLALAAAMVAHTQLKALLGWQSRLGLAALILIGSGISFLAFGEKTILRVELAGDAGSDGTRWCVAKATIEAIRDYPLFGTGLGTFGDVFPIYRTVECGIQGIWAEPHNSFLEGYLGLGLPFAVLLLVCLAILVRVIGIGLVERRRLRFVSIVTGAATVYIALHSLVDFPLEIHGIAVYFAALVGAGCGLAIARRTERRSLE